MNKYGLYFQNLRTFDTLNFQLLFSWFIFCFFEIQFDRF